LADFLRAATSQFLCQESEVPETVGGLLEAIDTWQGDTAEQINGKCLVLESVLVPVAGRWNEDLVQEAGLITSNASGHGATLPVGSKLNPPNQTLGGLRGVVWTLPSVALRRLGGS
jgi:hypothetical protein